MHLFADAAKVGQFPNACTTIVARTAEDLKRFRLLDHRTVIVRGTAAPWPRDAKSLSVNGNVVRNLCNSNEIVFAVDVEPS
jgi:hypothetical protein